MHPYETARETPPETEPIPHAEYIPMISIVGYPLRPTREYQDRVKKFLSRARLPRGLASHTVIRIIGAVLLIGIIVFLIAPGETVGHWRTSLHEYLTPTHTSPSSTSSTPVGTPSHTPETLQSGRDTYGRF